MPPLSLSKYDFFAEIPPHERGTCEQDAPHIRIERQTNASLVKGRADYNNKCNSKKR